MGLMGVGIQQHLGGQRFPSPILIIPYFSVLLQHDCIDMVLVNQLTNAPLGYIYREVREVYKSCSFVVLWLFGFVQVGILFVCILFFT